MIKDGNTAFVVSSLESDFVIDSIVRINCEGQWWVKVNSD